MPYVIETVVTLNSVDVTKWISSVSWDETAGDSTVETIGIKYVQRTGGKTDGTVNLEWTTDFIAAGSYATLKDLLGTVVELEFAPSTAAASATNPGRKVDVLITGWGYMGGAANAFSTFSTSWPFAGAVTEVVT